MKSSDVTPYDDGRTKKNQVRSMFDNIAWRYDFLNHFLSLGIDRYWRKRTIDQLKDRSPRHVLDLATGTADLAIGLKKRHPSAQVIGLDLSPGMIERGNAKLEKRKMEEVQLLVGDAENMPFESDTFDALTIAFGVRNFGDLEAGLDEMYRVMAPGGRLLILEFSEPTNRLYKWLFHLHFKYILPVYGRLISADPKAYTYLFDSVQSFPSYERFMGILESRGFKPAHYIKLTLGTCCIYIAEK